MQEQLLLYEGEGRIRRIDATAVEREARQLRALCLGALIGRALDWFANVDPQQRLRRPIGHSARPRFG